MQDQVDYPDPIPREGKHEELVAHIIHPWHRFFARMLDYLIFSFVLGWFFHFSGMPDEVFLSPFPFVGMMFFWTFIEAALISSWTSTIGKSLFRIYIRKQDGKKLSYSEALNRSLSVWWLGLGAGLPIVMLVTMIVACVKLSNNFITTWDKRGACFVQHKKISALRIVGIIFLYVIFFFLTGPSIYIVRVS